MAPKFYHFESPDIDQFLREHHLEDIGMSSQESRIINSAINAASRGILDIQIEPKRFEYVISVNGKFSRSLDRFAYLCGDIHIAINFLYKLGAAVNAYALGFTE